METGDYEKKDEFNDSLKLKEGNISLVLDSYDALFSDFDPRPYSERGLSDDFLFECKRTAREKEGITELRLLIPGKLRKINEEAKIKKRLREYFKKQYHEKLRVIRSTRKRGFGWFVIGSVILMISTVLYEYRYQIISQFLKFLYDFILIISQPAGWFTLWEGLDMIFLKPKENLPDYEFYKKMSNANIYFLNY